MILWVKSGLFSVFDADIIKNTDVYTGGFSAEYGGRISSIMDIKTKDGNKKKVQGKFSSNTFGSKILVEGPLKEGGGTTFLFSGIWNVRLGCLRHSLCTIAPAAALVPL